MIDESSLESSTLNAAAPTPFDFWLLPTYVKKKFDRWWKLVWSRQHVALTILILAYIVWFSHLSLKVFSWYGDPPFDMSVYSQGLWLMSHFHDPFITVMGRNLFGDHTSFILVLLAPFYRLFPEPQGLLIFQTVIIAVTAIPIFVLSQRLIKNTVVSTMLAAVYLLNPAVQQENLDQFHPASIEVFLVCVAVYAAFTRKTVLLGVFVVLTLLVMEDAAVYVVPIGLWVAWRRDHKAGFLIVCAGVAGALIDNLLIIPGIIGRTDLYANFIPFGGMTSTLTTLIRHPGTFWNYLVAGGRPWYLWQMGFSTGFAFLLAPEIALIAILVLVENTLSTNIYMHHIDYQYSAPIVPVLVLGVVYAISRPRWQGRGILIASATLIVALWSCLLWGLAPFSEGTVPLDYAPTSATAKALSHLEAEIPPNAVVSAYYTMVSHLDQRLQIYLWPNPFYAFYYGVGLQGGERLPAAPDVQYLLLPYPLTSASYSSVLASLSSSFSLVKQVGGVALYKRAGM